MSTTSPKEIIELALVRPNKSPQARFKEMADLCVQYGIDKCDMYGDFAATAESSWIRKFERQVADRLGKEDAIFVVSGTMSQGIAAKIHEAAAQHRTTNFVCHYSSHLLVHEQNSYPTLLKLTPLVVTPDGDGAPLRPLEYRDVASLLDQEPAPFMVILECPHRELGGHITSWEDLRLISAHCRRRGVAFHCDGARLWEAEAAYCSETPGQTLVDLCSLFDSIYVSFYKGLGGITGAMLLGSIPFVAEARVWNRRFGGNIFCQLPLGLTCLDGFLRNGPPEFSIRRARMQAVISALSISLADITVSVGTDCSTVPVVQFVPPVPVVSLIHAVFKANFAAVAEARDKVAQETGIVCFANLRPYSKHAAAAYCPSVMTDSWTITEFNMGPLNGAITDEIWIRGWTMLARLLVQGKP